MAKKLKYFLFLNGKCVGAYKIESACGRNYYKLMEKYPRVEGNTVYACDEDGNKLHF